VIDGPFLARGEPAMSLDDQRVLEELHVEIVFVDASDGDDDLDRRRVSYTSTAGRHFVCTSRRSRSLSQRSPSGHACCERVVIA
jgi:hypothetical protein